MPDALALGAHMARLGLDFGTSNTAAGVMAGGRPFAIPLEPGLDTLPSAIFIDPNSKAFLIGSAAAQAMRMGQEGRFMRALKSVLGTPLAHEPRQFLGQKMTLIDIIATFLAEIKARAQSFTGMQFDAVLSGRPVHFHSNAPQRDAQAQADLRSAYEKAGFQDVAFLPEPEAAALAVQGTGRMLIVDIGGGTSDFTLCLRENGQTRVLASRGLRLGGTDFDRSLSLAAAMPLLGYGALLGAEFGPNKTEAPRALFHDLATWQKIPFVYDGQSLRDVRRWVRLAEEPRLFERLGDVLEMHLGHDVAYAVEAGKIGANKGQDAQINLDVVERGLQAPLGAALLQATLGGFAAEINAQALATIADAGCQPAQVDMVVFVGGSSLMGVVRQALAHSLPDARQENAEVFTAVVHGLAIAAA